MPSGSLVTTTKEKKLNTGFTQPHAILPPQRFNSLHYMALVSLHHKFIYALCWYYQSYGTNVKVESFSYLDSNISSTVQAKKKE
jgi:hypothetical protein